MQIVCLLVLSWVRDPHQILRGICDLVICRPSAGRAAGERDRLLRERPGRVSGQALVLHFPSVNTRKPHPELQTDIQKSILSCRLGDLARVRLLEAQKSVPRFQTPDRG